MPVFEKQGMELEKLVEEEQDPALGNGGLGRLAACFLDSMASLDMPGCGYGINYDYGLFRQIIVNGYQRERPDYWPNRSSPWLIRRSGDQYILPIYGKIEERQDEKGYYTPKWIRKKLFIGRPHDIMVSGHRGRTVNRLRLFQPQHPEILTSIFSMTEIISRRSAGKSSLKALPKFCIRPTPKKWVKNFGLFRNISWWPVPEGYYPGV